MRRLAVESGNFFGNCDRSETSLGTDGGGPVLLLRPWAPPHPPTPSLRPEGPLMSSGGFSFSRPAARRLKNHFEIVQTGVRMASWIAQAEERAWRAGRDGRPMQQLGDLIEVPFLCARHPAAQLAGAISELGRGAGDGEILSFQRAQLVLGSN
jgi:hypothetical protein